MVFTKISCIEQATFPVTNNDKQNWFTLTRDRRFVICPYIVPPSTDSPLMTVCQLK